MCYNDSFIDHAYDRCGFYTAVDHRWLGAGRPGTGTAVPLARSALVQLLDTAGRRRDTHARLFFLKFSFFKVL